MRIFHSWPLLMSAMICLGGCGTSHTLGEDPGSQVRDDTAQVAPPAVSEQEEAAIATLQELGAVLDLNDAGHVRIVELKESEATDDHLKLLGAFPYLEALDITGGKITAGSLAHLKRLTGLQRLYLDDLPITNDDLATLAKLTKLEVLSLRNTRIDDEGSPRLKALSQLQVLNLAKTGITNKTLEQIQDFEELDTLVLADTKATGEGLEYLKSLKKLRVLNVDRCQDLEGHLLALSGLTELRMLYTHGCTIPEEEVDELQDRNPRLAVFGD